MNQGVKHIVLRSSWEEDLIFGLSSRLKQHALLFDQIGIFRLENLRQAMSSSYDREDSIRSQAFISDTLWLEESGIIFEPKNETGLKNKYIERFLKTNSSKSSEFRDLMKVVKSKLQEQRPQDALELHKSAKDADGIILRLMSLIMEMRKKTSIVTTLPFSQYTQDLPISNIYDVAQIVISKLPLPDDTTPWEKVIDFREDSDNQKNLLALRRWIRRTSTQNLSANEIEEELEWLLNEFQATMKLHKLKANTEALEVMVKAPLEIIENLIKLKFSKIPEPLFALKKRQINLMEAELNAPGREMSYIIKTRDAFQSHE